MRAGRISVSQAPAAASKPSSWATITSSASGPCMRASRPDPLPAHQETQEVARGDRLDLGAQAPDGIAVNPGEQPALAPFVRAGLRREAPAHGEAFGLQRRKRSRDFVRVEPERCCQRGLGDRPQPLETTAQDLDQRVLRRPVRASEAAGAAIAGSSLASGHSAWNCGQALGGDPQRRPRPMQPRHAALPRQRARASRASPVRPALPPRSGSRARPGHRAARPRSRHPARPRPARARSPRDRAGRDRLLPPAPASAGSSPPACGAPRAARRRDRHKAARRAPRARSGDGSVRSHVTTPISPDSSRASSRSRPAMSMASFRQSAMVWPTRG